MFKSQQKSQLADTADARYRPIIVGLFTHHYWPLPFLLALWLSDTGDFTLMAAGQFSPAPAGRAVNPILASIGTDNPTLTQSRAGTFAVELETLHFHPHDRETLSGCQYRGGTSHRYNLWGTTYM